MFKFNGPVILNTYNAYISFNKPFLKRWKERIIFAYNPDFATLNYKLYNSLDIPYLHLPLASDPDIFKPINSKKIYDIAFLGNGHSGYGREKYIEKLIKYTVDNKLSIFLAGSGWEKFGYPFMIIQHGEQTNLVYNQTKVCINIHNDRQFAGVDKEMDANNRLFDLAMAGCCQVTNGKKMIMKYFNNNVYGMQVLLESMVRNHVDKIVFSSTAAVYGEPKRVPIMEDDPTEPTNPYGESKRTMEKMMKWVSRADGIRYVSLRYFNAAGALDDGSIGEDHTSATSRLASAAAARSAISRPRADRW